VMSRSYGPGRYDPAYEEQGRDYPVGYVRWTEQRNMDAFLEMVRSDDVRIDGLTTHRYEVQDATRAYDMIANASEPYVGILLSYPSEATLSPPSPASTALGTGKTGIVLVGAGSFATRVLVPALKAAGSLKLEAVVTARGLSAVDAARKFGFAAAESSPGAAFARPGVGAVAIATRHDSHAELVVQALRAGLDVFVEKPLCIDVGGLAGIVSAQREAGRICMVGFNRRFAPATEVLVSERRRHIGPVQCVVRVNAGAVPRDSWLTDPDVGGGRIVGELCHFIDLACHLVGSSPVSVSAAGLGADVSPVTQDCLSVNLTHDDGSLSTVVYSAGGDPRLPKERVELFVGGAAAVIDDFRRATVYQDGRVISRTTRGQDKGHTAEVAAFVRAVATCGAIDRLPFHDCVRTTLATFAVVESLRTGSAVRLETFAASVLGPGPDE
jgi:predicted dehydrogenase